MPPALGTTVRAWCLPCMAGRPHACAADVDTVGFVNFVLDSGTSGALIFPELREALGHSPVDGDVSPLGGGADRASGWHLGLGGDLGGAQRHRCFSLLLSLAPHLPHTIRLLPSHPPAAPGARLGATVGSTHL